MLGPCLRVFVKIRVATAAMREGRVARGAIGRGADVDAIRSVDLGAVVWREDFDGMVNARDCQDGLVGVTFGF